ncbi:MAG: hypothetical protein GF398_18650 [Chitinivibrionales bacterium]|nr:hypothetical protein [Chitinivibrionales bacterium]
MQQLATGYIEGYYAKLLSWQERARIVKTLSGLKLNSYLYAPKEDAFHRVRWQIRYSRAWLRAYRNWIRTSAQAGINIIPAIAPGLSFDYCSTSHYRKLLSKCASLLTPQTDTFALLMDDIDEHLPRPNAGNYSSLGRAHGVLLSRLRNDLSSTVTRPISLWFCPTIYCDQMAGYDVANNTYLNDLQLSMPEDVSLLWTGTEVISPSLKPGDIRSISKLFGKQLIIWDNYYANDYCPSKAITGPYLDRSDSLVKHVKGILLNPAGLPQSDDLHLGLYARMLDGAAPYSSWRQFLSSVEYGADINKIAHWLRPFCKIDSLPNKITRPARQALCRLIRTWKSPLLCEWYTGLYMLEIDIRLADNSFPSRAQRDIFLAKKYSPFLRASLS